MFKEIWHEDKKYEWSENDIVSKLVLDSPFSRVEFVKGKIEYLVNALYWGDGGSATITNDIVFYSVTLEDDFYFMVWVSDKSLKVFLERDFEEDSYRRLNWGRYTEEQFFQKSLLKDPVISWETYNTLVQFGEYLRSVYEHTNVPLQSITHQS